MIFFNQRTSPRLGVIFDTISVKARWEPWCRWNCDLRVINAREKKKRHFLLYLKCRHDGQITWPHAYFVILGSRCKMANSSSKDETDTLPKRPTRIQLYQFEPIRQDFERVPEHSVSFEAKPHAVFHGCCFLRNCTHWSAHYTNGRDAAQQEVSSCELYKLNPLSPHCGSSCTLYLGSSDSPDWRHFRKIKLIKNPIKQFWLFFISLNLKLVTHLSIILMVILCT